MFEPWTVFRSKFTIAPVAPYKYYSIPLFTALFFAAVMTLLPPRLVEQCLRGK